MGGSAASPRSSRGSRTRGQIQKWPTCGGIGYITPAVWGSPGRCQNQKGATCGRIGYITPAAWGNPKKGTKSERDHLWADWLHHPCRLGGPPQGDKNIKGPHVGGLATSSLPSGRSPTRGQNQKGTKCERMGYPTPAVCRVPNKRTKSEMGHVWADWYITPAVWVVPNNGAISERDHMGANWLHLPCRLGGQQQGPKSTKGPHVSRLANSPCRPWGHQQADKIKNGQLMSGLATLPLPSGGVPKKGTKLERDHMWVDWLHHPCRLGGPQQGGKIRMGPHVQGSATSPLPSGGSAARVHNQKGTTCGRIGSITPAV